MGLKLTHKGVCRYFSVCPRVSRVANRADSLGLYKRGSHCRGQRLQLGRDFALKSTTLRSHSGAVLKIRHDCVEVARNHNQKKMLLHLPRWWWLSGSRCHRKKAVGWKKKRCCARLPYRRTFFLFLMISIKVNVSLLGLAAQEKSKE